MVLKEPVPKSVCPKDPYDLIARRLQIYPLMETCVGYLPVESGHKEPRSEVIAGNKACDAVPDFGRGSMRRRLVHKVDLSED